VYPALLYQKLKNKAVRCQVCQRRCLIPEGKTGYCQSYINKNGKLYSLSYGIIAAINNDPIEKKPVFHYQPGSTCFSIGTYGCNFRCRFCQNWDIVYADILKLKTKDKKTKVTPEETVKMALKTKAAGIAFTYNEPTVWLEYSLDVFKLAKNFTSQESRSLPRHLRGGVAKDQRPKTKNHLYTVWVTNGYATKKAIDLIAPYLDVWRVDLKSFADQFYQKLAYAPHAQPIFENTKYIHKHYPNIHIECVTNIIPGWNDDDQNLKHIARWIAKNLGPKTPWHVTRFYPAAQMMDTPPTPKKTLVRAKEIGQKAGLQFVYLGNIDTKDGENTYCPNCGTLCVKRQEYSTQILAVNKNGCCSRCNEPLNIKIIS